MQDTLLLPTFSVCQPRPTITSPPAAAPAAAPAHSWRLAANLLRTGSRTTHTCWPWTQTTSSSTSGAGGGAWHDRMMCVRNNCRLWPVAWRVAQLPALRCFILCPASPACRWHRPPLPLPPLRRKTAGLPAPGESYGGWEWSDSEVRGQFIGHYLSATAFAAQSTGAGRAGGRAGGWVGGAAGWVGGAAGGGHTAAGQLLMPACEAAEVRHLSGSCAPLPLALQGVSSFVTAAAAQSSPFPDTTTPHLPLPAGRPEFRDRCSLMVGELKKVQDAFGNGYLGGQP